MVTALVLIHAEGELVDEVAQKLIEYPGVSEVYSVAGEWDLAAVLRVSRNEDVADLMTHRILKTPGVQQTETLIAFKAYSRHDLDRMFAIGFPEGSAGGDQP
jgi:DNA-binding Lrp family transcriptional regulator